MSHHTQAVLRIERVAKRLTLLINGIISHQRKKNNVILRLAAMVINYGDNLPCTAM